MEHGPCSMTSITKLFLLGGYDHEHGAWSEFNLYIYFEIVGRLSDHGPRIKSQNVGEVIVNLPHIF